MIDKRVVIITGGAGGIGSAVARKFADMGDVAVMIDTDQAAGDAMMKEFQNAGKDAAFYKTDISDEKACEVMIADIIEKYGRIDVLHNNAGIIGKTRDFLQMETCEFRQVIEINLISAFVLSRLVANVMIKAGRTGVIVNTSSVNATLPNHEAICYSISKAGVSMLTQTTARELGGKGIRVVAVAPAWVRSIVKGGSVANPFERPDVKEMMMDQRVIEPEEVAEAVYFLSTPAASGINGTTVKVDLGYTGFKMTTSLYSEE